MTNSFNSKKTQKKLLGIMIILLSLIAIIDVKGYIGGILSYCFVFLCGDFFILPFFLIILSTIPLLTGKKVKFNFAYVGAIVALICLLAILSSNDLPVSVALNTYLEEFKYVTPPFFTNLFKGHLDGGFIGVILYSFLASIIGTIVTNLLLYLVLIFASIVALKPVIFSLVNKFYNNKQNKATVKKEKKEVELKEFDFVEQNLTSIDDNKNYDTPSYSNANSYNEPRYQPKINIVDLNSEQEEVKPITSNNAHIIEDLSFDNNEEPLKNEPQNEINNEPSSFSFFDDDLGFDETPNLNQNITQPSTPSFSENRTNPVNEDFDPNKLSRINVDELTEKNPIKVETIRNDGEKNINYSEGYSDYTNQDSNCSNSMNIFKKDSNTIRDSYQEPISSINSEINDFSEKTIEEPIVTPKELEEPIKENTSSIPVANETKTPIVEEEEEREFAKVEVEPIVKETPKVVHNNRPYRLPPISLLNDVESTDNSKNQAEAEYKRVLLNAKLKSLNIKAEVHDIIVAPSFTRFEIEVASDVKLSAFNSIKQDIMMALSAEKINILTPIPGTSYVGIEIPNVTRSAVSFKEVLQDILYPPTQPLLTAVGKDIVGETVKIKINKAPHLLIAGTTGSGKSVCINTIIATLLMRTSYKDVRMILIDPKKVEMAVYAGIPHLLCPVINDPLKATIALKRVCDMMDDRYQMFADIGNEGPVCRDIERYNQIMDERGEEKLPYVVVVIDELSDLMMLASKDVEDSIRRITQLARSAGIHLIVATQRPSVDVITGVIKANIPSRIAFATSNNADSRTILDSGGAEDLLGKGDSLVHMAGDMKMSRVQGAYVSDEEIERICDYVKQQRSPIYDPRFQNLEPPQNDANFAVEGVSADNDDDDIYNNILELLKTQTTISTSFLQRRFSMGFPKAGRMIDRLEQDGFISPSRGSKPREVYQDKL